MIFFLPTLIPIENQDLYNQVKNQFGFWISKLSYTLRLKILSDEDSSFKFSNKYQM